MKTRLMMGCMAALMLIAAQPQAMAGGYAPPPGYMLMKTPEGKIIEVPNRDLRKEFRQIEMTQPDGQRSVFAEARRVTTTKLLVGAGTGVIAGVVCAMIGGGTPVAILCGVGGAVLGYVFLGPPVENWWENRRAQHEMAGIPAQTQTQMRLPPPEPAVRHTPKPRRPVTVQRPAPRPVPRPAATPAVAPPAGDIVLPPLPAVPPVAVPRDNAVVGVELFPCTDQALRDLGKWCGPDGTTVTPPVTM